MIVGIDEAGRGPVIGPLVIAAAEFEDKDISELKRIRVRDSKRLSSLQRELLEPKIRSIAKRICVTVISASEVDYLRRTVNLNDIEAINMADSINELKPKIVYVDAVDTNEEVFAERIKCHLQDKKVQLFAKHKADVIYPVVSAASIIAKVKRDEEVSKLKKKYGEIGSGYPSDPVTINFLKNYYNDYGGFPDIIRHSWNTIERLVVEGKQSTLKDWNGNGHKSRG